MKVQLDHIGEEGLDLQETLSVAWLTELLGDEELYHPVDAGHLSVHLERADDVVHVRGDVRVNLQCACVRCLEPVQLAVQTPLDMALFPRGHEPVAKDDGELAEDDLGVGSYDDREIDLAGVVHDGVCLDLPLNPVCSATCAGLCPYCGENRNVTACQCVAPVDHRWSALADIKRVVD